MIEILQVDTAAYRIKDAIQVRISLQHEDTDCA